MDDPAPRGSTRRRAHTQLHELNAVAANTLEVISIVWTVDNLGVI